MHACICSTQTATGLSGHADFLIMNKMRDETMDKSLTRNGNMNKLTKALATGALALTLALGGNLGAAQAAEAATTRYYISYYNGQCWMTSYTDYNWWEETFQGKRDQTIRLYPTSCIQA